MKKALITVITGQDGSYLAEFLLLKGCEAHGIIKQAGTFSTTESVLMRSNSVNTIKECFWQTSLPARRTQTGYKPRLPDTNAA